MPSWLIGTDWEPRHDGETSVWRRSDQTWQMAAALGLVCACGLVLIGVASSLLILMGSEAPVAYWLAGAIFWVLLLLAVISLWLRMIRLGRLCRLWADLWVLAFLLMVCAIDAGGELFGLFGYLPPVLALFGFLIAWALANSQVWVAWQASEKGKRSVAQAEVDGDEDAMRSPLVAPPRAARQRVAMIAANGVLIAALLGGVFFAWGPDMPFDPETWQTLTVEKSAGPLWSISVGENTRARMVDDLLANHVRVGMSSDEVMGLLGRYDCGGDGFRGYALVHGPRLDQAVVSFLRWGTFDPALELEFNEAPGGLKLARVSVGIW